MNLIAKYHVDELINRLYNAIAIVIALINYVNLKFAGKKIY